MQIQGSIRVHGAQAVNAPHRTAAASGAAPAAGRTFVDELSLSPQAQFVSQARDLPEIRSERVASLRAAIASGAYETEQKLSSALDRLLDEIG